MPQSKRKSTIGLREHIGVFEGMIEVAEIGGFPPGVITETVSLDDILMERRLELAHEGFKYHDVKRLKGIVGTMPYNDNKLIYPIPQRELEVNKNLVQNPGY